MKSKKNEYEDDGHTIVDMSLVERPNLFSFRSLNYLSNENKHSDTSYSYSKEERRWAILGALKASLFIGMAYIIGLGILILFLVLYFMKS